MIRPFLLLAGAAALPLAMAAPAAQAASSPAAPSRPASSQAASSQAGDPRLASRVYNPDEVVRLEGRAGVQAAIAFAEDEHIENVAIGDSNAWQVTPNKRANMLFVKPLGAAARTNMTVITDRRSYTFDLVAGAALRPVYVLRFSYPADEKARAEQAAKAASASAASGLTGEEADLAAGTRPADPASLNFAWGMKGKAALHPARIYDDGRSVYLVWQAGSPQPAILTRDARGAEGPVNYAVRGQTIVIEGVPGVLVLRAGKDVALLENRGPVPAAPVPDGPAPTGPASAAPASAIPPQALAAAALKGE